MKELHFRSTCRVNQTAAPLVLLGSKKCPFKIRLVCGVRVVFKGLHEIFSNDRAQFERNGRED
jgi:hypothetical protein